MNALARVRAQLSTSAVLTIGGLAGLAAVAVMIATVDASAFAAAARTAGRRPGGLAVALGAFGLAFVLRSVAWRRVLPSLSLGHAAAGIHVALAANHLLPFRMGEPLRVVSAVRRSSVGFAAAGASTVTLRALDLVGVVAIGLAAAPTVYLGLVGPVIIVVGLVLGGAAAGGLWWLRSLAARSPEVRLPGLVTVGASLLAWPAEAVLVWQVAQWAGIELSAAEALVVTTVSVGAQVIAVAPGGLGTYEAAAVAAYVALGHDPDSALVAALGAHALKTVYSIVAGGIAVVIPGPPLLGRLRLGRMVDGRDGSVTPAGAESPIVLFMPAFNEEGAVGSCVRRAPRTVGGRSVEVLVIDDGSSDATVERAIHAGAEAIELGVNRGLGAAVRVGLAEGVRRRAAAVVFCDADGEYPPEELEAMVAPILDGRADYVTGSRFLGRIDHMRPHRRIGNLVLTRLLSIVARRRITDGQTGYRALSPSAAEAAEIIHDFNYAQVLTLDLLAKGYRHVEVPISYHFRTSGDSFIKLGPYLRKVVPAVYRELNAAS